MAQEHTAEVLGQPKHPETGASGEEERAGGKEVRGGRSRPDRLLSGSRSGTTKVVANGCEWRSMESERQREVVV